ncbi:MAG: DUF2505 domain-containing protein [Pseudonocardia sp.]
MPRPIRYRTRSTHPADALYAAMVNRDQLEARLAELGGKGAELLEHTVGDGSARYRLRHGLAADQLPPVARVFMPDDLVIERTETWRHDGESRYTGDVQVSIPGTPGKVSGSQTLGSSEDGGSELAIDGQVEIPVPFIGGKIEDIVATQVGQLLGAENEFTQRWLAANSGS